jgi:Flp pilus assembly pilin Flp
MKLARLNQTFKRFLADESGPTATEYAVCLSLMILACLLTITALGTKTNDLFPDLAGVM